MRRKFAAADDPQEDPFIGFDIIHGKSPSIPILADSMNFMECELVRHLDVEGDHDIFVAQVMNARQLHQGQPDVHLREDGLQY